MLNEKVCWHFISDVLGIPVEKIRTVRLGQTKHVSILDFDLDQRPEYHKIYRLRDKEGYEFSDIFEVHILELGKPLSGKEDVDDWIRLINAVTEEEFWNQADRSTNC